MNDFIILAIVSFCYIIGALLCYRVEGIDGFFTGSLLSIAFLLALINSSDIVDVYKQAKSRGAIVTGKQIGRAHV